MKTILEILDSGTQWLQKKGIEDARRNMQLLMCHQLHCSKIQLYTSYDELMKEEDLVPLRAMLAERGEGKPLQHLMGSVEFYKHEFKTDGRALIPRPETEELVEICINLLSHSEKDTLEILDLGCGSGVIGLSLAAQLGEKAKVVCSDVSEAALELARENATLLTLNNVTFWQSDLFSSIEGSFDLIVANLPYVPETDRESLTAELAHDPDLALFGGEDGLDIIREFIAESKNHTNNQGKLALEIGIHQAPAVESLLISAGFEDVSTLSDLTGIARFPIATANFTESNQNETMDKLIVHGGTTLKGSINISGAKNASLPILAASLLTSEDVIIRRVPDVSDTNYMIQILSALGAEVERSSGTVRINCANIGHDAPYELVRKMRASICVMGPLLSRLGQAKVSLPGGCVIGDRPVDLHLKGLRALGADIDMEGGNMDMQAPDGLVGSEIDLRGKHGPTVLGTDNIMMAAVLAKGTTVIESAACEPEVVDLADFLNAMGAKIEGAGTRRITIQGVEKLHGVEHTIIPDRIEAGTFMVAGAMAGCKENGITLNRVNREHLIPTTEKLIEAGHTVQFNEAGTIVKVIPGANPIGCKIVTAPHPGFPTDMQAQFASLFAVTEGISVIEDTIFPQRFMHCAEMSRMGADIKVDSGTAVITGVKELSAAPVMASDLRASAALVLSALTAKGSTDIYRLYHIDRGYENIDEKLLALGANVERVRE